MLIRKMIQKTHQVRVITVLYSVEQIESAPRQICNHFGRDGIFFVTPPAEYRKPGVVWKIKRYLYDDKRAPQGWQDHFEKPILELGWLLREEMSLTKGHDHCGCACGRSLECWEAKTSRQLLCATRDNVETQTCGVHQNGKSVLFLGDSITMFKE